MIDYSNDALIENVKRRCSVPTSQLTLTENDIVLLANDELQTEIVPMMMAMHEEYFVSFVDAVSPADQTIEIPAGAVGSKLRAVAWVQNANPLQMYNLPRIDLDVVTGVGNWSYTSVAGFYPQGSDLILYPPNAVPTNTTIRLYYFDRSLVLAQPDDYGQITAVDVGTSTITLDNVPLAWETGTVLNAISSQPNFKPTNSAMTVVTTSSPSIILDTVEGLVVGDLVSDQGFSGVPQIPVEAHAYLAQLTAVKVLEAQGDAQGMERAQAKADKLMKNMQIVFNQRVDGSPKTIVNPGNGFRNGFGYRRGWNR